MSWSVSIIGRPEKVKAALEAESGRFTGNGKREFDAALPHLLGLVGLHNGSSEMLVKLSANGHAEFGTSGVQTYGSCSVTLEPFYAKLV